MSFAAEIQLLIGEQVLAFLRVLLAGIYSCDKFQLAPGGLIGPSAAATSSPSGFQSIRWAAAPSKG